MSKRWVLFSLLTLLLVLLVSFHLILQGGFISEKAKRFSEARVERLIGQKVRIEHVQLRLLSASVVMKGITFQSKAADLPPTLQAKALGIYFSPWSFLTQTFFIRKIVIESPSFYLTSESFNQRPFTNQTPPDEREKTPPVVVVRSILIEDGSVSYEGTGFVKKISLQHIGAEIEPDLSMRQFEVQLSGEEGGISTEKGERKIDRLEGDMVVLPDRVTLKKGMVASNQATLRTEGVFLIGEKGSVDLQIDGRLPIEETGLSSIQLPSGEKKLSGEATIQGRLSGSYPNLVWNGQVALPHLLADGLEIGSLAAQVSYQDQKTLLTALSVEIFSGTLSGEAEGTFSEGTLRYRLALQYKRLSLEKAKKAVYGLDKEIDRMIEGIFIDGDLALTGAGFSTEGLAGGGRLTLKRLPLFSPPFPTDSKRWMKLIALFQEGDISWKWAGGRLTVAQGSARFPQTEATFHGDWSEAEGFSMETALQSGEIQKIAAALDFPLTGMVRVNGTLSGKADHPVFKGRGVVEKWRFQNQSFGALSAQFVYQERRLAFKQGSLQAPTGMRKNKIPPYRFDGELRFDAPDAPAFEFRIKTTSADPQEILTLYKQTIPLQTTATGPLLIKGTPRAFSVTGPLLLGKGMLYGEPFDRGALELTVTQKEVSLRKVSLEKGKRRVEGEGAIQYQGTYRIALKAPQLRLQETNYFQARAPLLNADVAIDLSGEGSFRQPKLKMVASVEGLRFGAAEAGTGTIKVDWNGKIVRMEGDFPEKALSMEGELQLIESYPFSFQSRFSRIRVNPFFRDRFSGPLSKVVLLLTGGLEANGRFSEIERSRLSASLTDLSADFEGYPVQNNGPITLRADQGVLTFENVRLKGENTALEFNGGFMIFKAWDLFVKGEADLNLIKFFTKEISFAKGTATLDLRISDQWKSPHIRGQLALQNGAVRTAVFSQTIHITSLAAVLNEQRLILETFEGEVGRGRFRANGKADLDGFRIGPFGFLLELSDIRVNLFPDLPVTVGGEVFFQREGSVQTLKGELTVKKAVYEKRIDLTSFVSELRQKREEGPATEIPFIGGAKLNIHLEGKENISIDNNWAKASLAADLFLKGTIDRPLLIGRIEAPRGTIFFRNNAFKIEAASAEFLDANKIDPTFDIRANTTATLRGPTRDQDKKYEVDLSLTGTLSKFTLQLSSNPSLPEADILSLLAFGTTAEYALAQRGVVGSEAAGLAYSGFLAGPAQLLTEPIQKFAGIDRVQIDPYASGTRSSGASTPRLTAEKRLMNDRLVVIYTANFDPKDEDLIRMIYELSKNVSLVGERDEYGRIGGIIQFRFEFR